ncbi:hypothetical protein OROGR_007997 [Orobanche gracilis]
MINLNLSRPSTLSIRLFHLYLLIFGISVCVFSILVRLKLLSFSITSLPLFSDTLRISKPSTTTLLPRPQPGNPRPPTALAGLMHNMSDDELLSRASKVVRVAGEVFKHEKVAFMFLTPGPLPLATFWDRFFKGHEGMYSVYIHAHPSYTDSSVPPDSAFYGRRIPSQPVYWGTISMIDAERRLLANALLEYSSNRRFVLLSDSCIPLFNFTTIYNYLIGTNRSFLGSFDDPRKSGRGRYNRQMWPTIGIEQWRKGSQWFEIQRDLAVKIVSDKKYYERFREFCMPPCYSDEHYLPTLANTLCPESNSNRSVTWVDWSRGGPHPRKFGWIDVKIELLDYIRFGSDCMYNGKMGNICHLFARKFLPNTIRPLMRMAPSILGF